MRQKTVTEKYRAVLEGKMAKSEFVRQMRQQYPMHVTQFNGFDDSVQILKNRGLLFEAQAEKKAKVYDERPSLPYSDDAFQRGIRYELEAAGIATHDAFNIKLEDFDKAKKKAEDNLMKDPMHYLNLISGESSKVDKHDKEVHVKRGEGKVDVFNGMKKADLRESLQEGNYEKLAKDLNTTPEKIKAAIEKLRGPEKDQIEKDARKKAFGEADAREIPPQILKTYNINVKDAPTMAMALKSFFDQVNAEEPADFEAMPQIKRVLDILDKTIKTRDTEKFQQGNNEPEGDMNEEDDIPFKKVYQADFDELKKFLLNKTSASHDAHVLDGVFHELFESAENLVDEQPGTSEIDAIFTVAENLAEHYEENEQDEEAAIAEDVLSIIKPIAMASENKVEEAPSGLEEVMVAALRKGFNEEQIVDAINKIRDRKKGDGPDMDAIAQHTQWYNKEEVETNEGPEDEDDVRYFMIHFGHKFKEDFIVDYINSGNFKAALDQHPLEDEHKDFWEDELAQFDSDRDDVTNEKKGKDHDGDGDIDKDDYMAAKDKAIKKAMGKEEQLKEAIKKIIKESLLNEAATAKLSDIGDKYGDYKGMQVVINDLENIVTDMESYFAKTRERVQNAMDKIGQVETPDGMKVGAFLAPAIETAFFKDLNPVRKLSQRDIKLPQVKVARFDDLQREAEAGIEEEPKQTVFSPVNEKK